MEKAYKNWIDYYKIKEYPNAWEEKYRKLMKAWEDDIKNIKAIYGTWKIGHKRKVLEIMDTMFSGVDSVHVFAVVNCRGRVLGIIEPYDRELVDMYREDLNNGGDPFEDDWEDGKAYNPYNWGERGVYCRDWLDI